MHRTNALLPTFARGCALLLWFLLLILLPGCATPTQNLQDVGVVVAAPKARLPPLPTVVRETDPKPAGYFQRLLLDYLSESPPKPTP